MNKVKESDVSKKDITTCSVEGGCKVVVVTDGRQKHLGTYRRETQESKGGEEKVATQDDETPLSSLQHLRKTIRVKK